MFEIVREVLNDLLLLAYAYRAWVLGALVLLFYVASCWVSYLAGWYDRDRLSKRRRERETTMPPLAAPTFNFPPVRSGPLGRGWPAWPSSPATAPGPAPGTGENVVGARPADAPLATWPAAAAEERSAPPARPRSVAEEIVRQFNEGGEGLRQFRTELLRVANGDEVRDDPDAKPLLEPSPAGSYLLVRTADTTTGYVVPKPRLVVSRDEFRYGAFASLFRSNKPRSDIVYRQITLVAPAMVQLRGSRWEVTKPGELKLAGEEQVI